MLKELILDAVKHLPANADEDSINHEMRQYLERPIFEELHKRYLKQLQSWYSTYELPNYDTASNLVYIYETRKHYNLEFLIYNVLYFAPQFGLYITCSSDNYEMVCNILGSNKDRAKVEIIEDHPSYEAGRNAYNDYVKSSAFWNAIPPRIHCLLMAEVDSYMRYPIEEGMLDIDYCASRWGWDTDKPGGGGISLRNVEAMKTICAALPELASDIWAQDCWACEGVCALGLTFNSTFFMESCMQKEAVGVHQWWTFCLPLTEERLECYEEYMKLAMPL